VDVSAITEGSFEANACTSSSLPRWITLLIAFATELDGAEELGRVVGVEAAAAPTSVGVTGRAVGLIASADVAAGAGGLEASGVSLGAGASAEVPGVTAAGVADWVAGGRGNPARAVGSHAVSIRSTSRSKTTIASDFRLAANVAGLAGGVGESLATKAT